jgi:ribosomal protein S18 acetylase RimI-like enzyme
MAISIRNPRENDAFGIAHVEIEVWRDTYPTLLPAEYLVDRMDIARVAALWARRLQDANFSQHCQVALDDEEGVIGFITFGKPRDPDLPFDGEIYEVYVLTDYQDLGLGRRLCRAAANGLRRQGARSLTVEVLEGNPSRFFYEALGGKVTRRKDRPFAGLRLPSLIYGWENLSMLVSEDTSS